MSSSILIRGGLFQRLITRSFSSRLNTRYNKTGKPKTTGKERNAIGGRRIDKPFYLNDPRDDVTYLYPPQGPPNRDLRIYDVVPKDKIYRRPEWAAPTKPLSDNYDIMWLDNQAPEPLLDQHEYFRNFKEFWDGGKYIYLGLATLILACYLYQRKPPVTPRELPFDEGFIDRGSVNSVRRDRQDRYDPLFLEWVRAKHEEGMKHEWYRKEMGYEK